MQAGLLEGESVTVVTDLHDCGMGGGGECYSSTAPNISHRWPVKSHGLLV